MTFMSIILVKLVIYVDRNDWNISKRSVFNWEFIEFNEISRQLKDAKNFNTFKNFLSNI